VRLVASEAVVRNGGVMKEEERDIYPYDRKLRRKSLKNERGRECGLLS